MIFNGNNFKQINSNKKTYLNVNSDDKNNKKSTTKPIAYNVLYVKRPEEKSNSEYFKDDINKKDDSLNVYNQNYCVYMYAPEIKWTKIITAPKACDRNFHYIKYYDDLHRIEVEKSKIKLR